MNNHLHFIASHTPDNLQPAAVKAAIAFNDAAQAFKAKIASETSVDLATAATPADIARLHTAAVAFDLDHAVKVTHADTLARIAADRLEKEWAFAIIGLEAHFANQFDKYAAELQPAIDALAGEDIDALILEHYNPQANELRKVLGNLSSMTSIRNAYRFVNGSAANPILSNEFEASSRLAYFPNAQVEQQFRLTLRVNKTKDMWLTLARTPGVIIKWQTKEQQEAQPVGAAITRRNEQMAAGTYGTPY